LIKRYIPVKKNMALVEGEVHQVIIRMDNTKGVFSMKNTIKIIGIIALAAVIVFSMAACKRGGSEAASTVVTATTASDIDSLLAEYEKLVNEAAPFIHRIATGDTMAVIDLSNVQEKIEEVIEKFENFSESDFTEAQILKMDELAGRMLGIMPN